MQTFEFKLYSSKKNRYLHQMITTAAQIYNHCIALHKRYYKLFKKYLNKFQLQKHLAKLRKQARFCAWKQVGSQVIQDITDRIEKGYKLFFSNLKKRSKASPPSFKKRKKYKSCTFKQAGYKMLGGNKILIGKRLYKFHHSREILGEIKTLTIKRDPLGDIYLYFACQVHELKPERISSGKSVGFDFGLTQFLTLSDQRKLSSPEFFKKSLNFLRVASRKLSFKKKGSNNRHKARINLARLHKKVVNQRKDYHFKLANDLAKNYDELFFEDLDLKKMQKIWGRKISDLGFHKFLLILKHICHKLDAKMQKIDRYYPSSKHCHRCEYVLESLSLKTREWTCPHCTYKHDRELNAAVNIHRVGASTLGGDEIRLPIMGSVHY